MNIPTNHVTAKAEIYLLHKSRQVLKIGICFTFAHVKPDINFGFLRSFSGRLHFLPLSKHVLTQVTVMFQYILFLLRSHITRDYFHNILTQQKYPANIHYCTGVVNTVEVYYVMLIFMTQFASCM